MCGILTMVGPARDSFDPLPVLRELAHRGPDDQGTLVELAGDARVSLAHTRLSIIDLSDRGHQPMKSADGRAVLVFNGEIYNFQYLRSELESLGHKFRSRTDTEVLLNAYLEWGESCLDRLAGMWAFVIWDAAEKKLFGARDRFGIKPLYYTRAGGNRLAVASEIKALLKLPGVSTGPNLPRILDHFLFSLHDHTGETLFRDVHQIPPAHAFRLDVPSGRWDLWRYWKPDPEEPRRNGGPDFSEAKEFLREAMVRSVREHLVADVPVGFCLSGGIDSSAIVGVARHVRRDAGPLAAFTSAYDNSPYDERSFAEEVVRASGVDWHVTIPTPKHLFEDLDRLIYAQDEPPVHSSVYAQWCVMQLAREQGVTVLLDGQGADELFAGYPAYRDVWAADLVKSGRWIQAARTGSVLRGIYGLSSAGIKSTLFKVRSPAWHALSGETQRQIEPRLSEIFGGLQYTDLGTRLSRDVFELHLPKLLHYEDRNSMAFSIESRVPFLDHRLAELAMRMPIDWRLTADYSKWILRDSLRSFLPARIADRRDKIGFMTPEVDWMRQLVADRPETLREGWAARELSSPRGIGQLLRDVESGRTDAANAIWKLVCLNAWHRLFFPKHG